MDIEKGGVHSVIYYVYSSLLVNVVNGDTNEMSIDIYYILYEYEVMLFSYYSLNHSLYQAFL